MKRVLYAIITIGFLIGAGPVRAGWIWNGGEYVNFYGDSSGYSCHGQCASYCNPGYGSCTGPAVVEYTCDGKTNECGSNESRAAGSQSIGNPGCNKTVEIKVFGNSNGGDLLSYMVWYSGACTQPQTIRKTADFTVADIAPTPGAVAPTTPDTGNDIWMGGMALVMLAGLGFLAIRWAGKVWLG